ncbi:MAG: hypothetical protein AAB552_00275 [Patescibacteria group bacterium]
MRKIRMSCRAEDREGKDISIYGEGIGWIWLQVKSSEFGRKKFLRKYAWNPRIGVIVVLGHESSEDVWSHAINILLDIRLRLELLNVEADEVRQVI